MSGERFSLAQDNILNFNLIEIKLKFITIIIIKSIMNADCS